MTLAEYRAKYTKLPNKEKTALFNEFSIENRKRFLKMLPEEQRKDFIDNIRKQAVKDFWTHEQALIKEGKCTRDWTPEQVEEGLHISEK